MLFEPCLHRFERQAGQLQAEGIEEFCGRNPVFHGHGATRLEHHRLASSKQHQGGEWVERCGAFAAIEWHAEAQRTELARCAVETWAEASVGIHHARELLRLWPADAMGDQKGPNLRVTGLAGEHQLKGLVGFFATEAFAGVLATANLAK